MEKKILIFDFDGTLADSLSVMIQTFNQLAPRFNYTPLSEEGILALRGKSAREVVSGLGISKLKLPLVYQAGKKAFSDEIENIPPFTGIPALLETLARKYTLGIVTSNDEVNVRKFLDKNKIQVISFVYSDHSLFGKGKILKKLLKTYQIMPPEATYIGDEVRDIEAAREAGIGIVSVSWGFNTREVLERNSPDRLVDTREELLQAFSL